MRPLFFWLLPTLPRMVFLFLLMLVVTILGVHLIIHADSLGEVSAKRDFMQEIGWALLSPFLFFSFVMDGLFQVRLVLNIVNLLIFQVFSVSLILYLLGFSLAFVKRLIVKWFVR